MRFIRDLPALRKPRESARRALARLHLHAWTWGRALRLHRVTPVHMVSVGAVAFLFGVLTWERCGLAGCPNVQRLVAYQAEGGSVLLDRQDREFAVLRPVRREVVPLSSLPPYVGQAFIAIEDKRFRKHDGVDWPRVIGAAAANLAAGSVEQGASTITMQLARNAFPERLPATERTLRRKLLEARVARDIENRFDKDEILELYLNHIYFGGGAYGIEAASRYYFGKPAAELRQSQAALLAAIVKAPSNYDPRRYPDRARQRRNLVLDEMEKQELITAQEATGSRRARLGVVAQPPFRGREEVVAAYFVEEIRKVVEEHIGEQVYTSRLRIHTTLDVEAQRAAEEELVRQLQYIERGAYGRFSGPRLGTSDLEAPEGSPYLQGAVVMLEARTGDVLALVGGRDYRVSTFNRAVRSKRQAGSSFKPFVFAAAIEEGYPPSQPIADEPFSIRLAANRSWEPENYDGDYYGLMSMREALVNSRNIPTVRLASAVGVDDIMRTAHAAGIASEIPDQPSMALGAASVTPLELTTAYATFASLGDAVRPRMIRWVEGDDGSVLWEEGVQARQAIDPAVAYVLTDILRDAVNYGTGAAVRAEGFGGPVAGKTGTTNDGRDAWFIGYTPEIVAGVWVGFDQPRPILQNASGGRVAAPVWGRMMRRVYRDRQLPEDWRPPATVVWRRIDPYSGRVLSQGCWPEYGEPSSDLFILGLLPESACPRSGQGRGLISSILRALGIGGGGGEPEDRRGRRSRGQNDGRPAADEARLEEVLGAPPLGGIDRRAQDRAASANPAAPRSDPHARSRAERR